MLFAPSTLVIPLWVESAPTQLMSTSAPAGGSDRCAAGEDVPWHCGEDESTYPLAVVTAPSEDTS